VRASRNRVYPSGRFFVSFFMRSVFNDSASRKTFAYDHRRRVLWVAFVLCIDRSTAFVFRLFIVVSYLLVLSGRPIRSGGAYCDTAHAHAVVSFRHLTSESHWSFILLGILFTFDGASNVDRYLIKINVVCSATCLKNNCFLLICLGF